MKITIPERIVEAIEEGGEELTVSSFKKAFASITSSDPHSTKVAASGHTLQEALDNLNEYLPLTMREIALMDSKPEGGQP